MKFLTILLAFYRITDRNISISTNHVNGLLTKPDEIGLLR